MKRILSLFIFSVMLLLFAMSGCSNIKKDDNVIEIWGGSQWSGVHNEKIQKFVEYFNNSQKAAELGFTIKFSYKNTLTTSLGSALKINNAADIILWDRFFTPSNTSMLLPLDELILQDEIDKEIFNQEAYNESVVDNIQYGLPLDLDTHGIFINMDVFDEYNKNKSGSERAVLPTTWSELYDTAKKLTVGKGDKISRAGLNLTSLDGVFFAFTASAGSSIIDLDPSSQRYGLTNVMTPEARDAMTLFHTMMKSGEICNEGLGGKDAFINSKLAMTFGSLYFPSSISAYMPNANLKFIPIPKRDMTVKNGQLVIDGTLNGTRTGALGGYCLSIANPSEEFKDEKWEERKRKSWEVIKCWLLDDDMSMKFHQETETLSARISLHTDSYFTSHKYIADALQFVNNYKARPNVAGYEAFEAQVVRAQMQKLFNGTYPNAATTLDQIKTNGDTMLNEAQK